MQGRKRKRDRLRVGYVSADFKLKATSYLLRDFFGVHDGSRFEVFIYATTHDSAEQGNQRSVFYAVSCSMCAAHNVFVLDGTISSRHLFILFASETDSDAAGGAKWRSDIKQSVKAIGGRFVDVAAKDLSVQQLALLIEEKHQIQVLVDLDGHSNNGVRMRGLFALHPAPIQISYLVYVGTTGAPYIEYVVTDAEASPAQYNQYYSEKVLHTLHCTTSVIL
jgi:predicted O-linked N-acetylglucosamine transferase (SPINDLY family)